jgi:hypothetical protein
LPVRANCRSLHFGGKSAAFGRDDKFGVGLSNEDHSSITAYPLTFLQAA